MWMNVNECLHEAGQQFARDSDIVTVSRRLSGGACA